MSSIKKVIVVGSGIAALSFAKTISESRQVIMMTKKQFSSSNSMLAQGGIARLFSTGFSSSACTRHISQLTVITMMRGRYKRS
nr:FAD-binding protein [Bacillus pumilus]